uniref:E3 ubiquitin-protein ligase RNF138 n=1 Tax=Equus asinus TaxID=9793 RepID=A0A9L0K2H0_EQUAS|nr:E3 ubiquitin-protein ligase RNF138 isoform X2 [Equus asinus]XP_044630471.1 E3 ubiquitin-protein ligase RNF138 isoform X2 [Equus asinus]
MAEELSVATSYTEDDFYCPVCQEVLKTPVRTAACQHVFCRKCFLTAMRESGIHCPLCRGNVTRRERACPERALDLENIMRKFSGSCRCCAKQIKFYRMRHHYKSCKKYQDEYGVSSIIPNFQISQDSVGNRRMANMHMCDLKSSDKANTQLPTNQVKKWDIFQDLRISLSAHAHLNPILPERRESFNAVIGVKHPHLITQKLIKRVQVLGIPPLSVPCVKNQILPDNVYWITVTVITYFR